MKYVSFLETKRLVHKSNGVQVRNSEINQVLFGFQRDLVRWSTRKGRAAVFADTGLGKTFIQLEWARLINERCLIVAPLSVARQTIRESKKINIDVKYVRSMGAVQDGINITNYEMIDKFDPSVFGSVVLDESSILKSLTGKTRSKLIEMFSKTSYRLCCTATPAPNDIAEIANHAEFLGIMSRVDMLATFFVHDDDGWRLKKHAKEPFFRWLASWGMSIKKPSDIGYTDDGYILPPLNINPRFIKTDVPPADGMLFWNGLKGITERSRIRKETAEGRVHAVAEIVRESGVQWILWCGINDEANSLARLIPGSVNVQGSDSAEVKAASIEKFQDGKIRVLITKPKIAGFGMNFQNCSNMAFVGLSDSWEAYYQCVRRCWRFGQENPVNVHIVLSDAEAPIYENVMRKEREAAEMSENLIENVREFEREEFSNLEMGTFEYQTDTAKGDKWTMMLGDSCERLKEIENESVHLSIFSPPFQSLYTYSPTERDIGNSKTVQEFFQHFNFIIQELLRITVPGRNCCVHVAQVPAMLVRDGYIGLKDMRGDTINAFENNGWIFHGDVTIDKDPQAQAIRTHSKALGFNQLRKDASWLRPALADYILVFRKPGDNPIPVKPDITNNEWIEWARPIWYGIKETDTLNVTEARENEDERHICPLQLGTIHRCIRLWSNKGETVCSPFAGIGSEGYEALSLNRHFIGCELKKSYFDVAVKNLQSVEGYGQQTLFQEAR
jgi:DNA modification methylase/superfamily II DNA or RNA helicase